MAQHFEIVENIDKSIYCIRCSQKNFLQPGRYNLNIKIARNSTSDTRKNFNDKIKSISVIVEVI